MGFSWWSRSSARKTCGGLLKFRPPQTKTFMAFPVRKCSRAAGRRSEPSRDKGNHSPTPPRAPVHAALARGGLDHGAYFTSERAHCEKFAAKGLDRTTTSRPEKRGLLSANRQGPGGQEVTYPNRSIGEWSS